MSIYRVMLKKKSTKKTIVRTFVANHPEAMKAKAQELYPNYYFDHTLSTRNEPQDIVARKKRQLV